MYAVVTAHRGRVAVESAPGRTEFTVRLPLNPELPSTVSQPATGSGRAGSEAAADAVHQDVTQVVQ